MSQERSNNNAKEFVTRVEVTRRRRFCLLVLSEGVICVSVTSSCAWIDFKKRHLGRVLATQLPNESDKRAMMRLGLGIFTTTPTPNHERLQNPSSNPSASRTRRIISPVVIVVVAHLASSIFSLPLIVFVPIVDVVAATSCRRRLECHPMLLAHRSYQQGCQYERSLGCLSYECGLHGIFGI